MGSKSKKIIMIIITIFVIFIVGTLATMFILTKFKKEEVVVQESVYKLPEQTLYYVNDAIYKNEGVNPETIDENIKVDFTEYKLKENVRNNLNINFESEIIDLQKNKNSIYGLYDDSIVILNSINKIRRITSEYEKIIAYKIKGDYVLKYTEPGKNALDKKKKSIELFNLYNSANFQISTDEVKTFDMDSDGIYVVCANGKNKNKLVRTIWSDKNKVIINDDETDQIVKIGDWIYYINKSKNNELYRVYKDGTKKESLSNQKLEIPESQKGKYYADNYIAGYLDNLYYINTADNNKLYKMQLSTKEQKPLINKNVETFKLENGYIYYTVKNENGLYIINENGENDCKILTHTPQEYIIN